MKFKKDNKIYKVTGVTPYRIYYEDTFNGATGFMELDEFEVLKADGQVQILER